jgi:ribosomal protein S27E
MGDAFDFRCDRCSAVELVFFGAGMAGSQTAHYCEVCGAIDYTHFGFDPEGRDDEFMLRSTARCDDHPDAKMIEFGEGSEIPCPKCGDGTRRKDAAGEVAIWD